MKILAGLGCLAVIGLIAAAYASDCTVGQTEKAKFCEKCDRVIDAAKAKDKIDKEGKCKECSEKVKDIEQCVKKCFDCN